jgi:hypothetical protein
MHLKSLTTEMINQRLESLYLYESLKQKTTLHLKESVRCTGALVGDRIEHCMLCPSREHT